MLLRILLLTTLFYSSSYAFLSKVRKVKSLKVLLSYQIQILSDNIYLFLSNSDREGRFKQIWKLSQNFSVQSKTYLTNINSRSIDTYFSLLDSETFLLQRFVENPDSKPFFFWQVTLVGRKSHRFSSYLVKTHLPNILPNQSRKSKYFWAIGTRNNSLNSITISNYLVRFSKNFKEKKEILLKQPINEYSLAGIYPKQVLSLGKGKYLINAVDDFFYKERRKAIESPAIYILDVEKREFKKHISLLTGIEEALEQTLRPKEKFIYKNYQAFHQNVTYSRNRYYFFAQYSVTLAVRSSSIRRNVYLSWPCVICNVSSKKCKFYVSEEKFPGFAPVGLIKNKLIFGSRNFKSKEKVHFFTAKVDLKQLD